MHSTFVLPYDSVYLYNSASSRVMNNGFTADNILCG